MNVLIVSENASYLSGGAEKSLLQYCALNFNNQCQLTFIVKSQEKEILEYEFLDRRPKYILINANFIKIFEKIPFLYTQIIIIVNFWKIWIEVSNCDILLTQNRWAPYVVSMTVINSIITRRKLPAILYFVRDEKCLNYYVCYTIGLRKLAWYLRHLIETPSRWLHRALTIFAFRNSCVIFNSHFMASFSKKMRLYPRESKVLFPLVERIDKTQALSWLNEQSEFVRNLSKQRSKNIVMIGDEVIKGFTVFKTLSTLHPKMTFICFAKSFKKVERIGDIIFFPWVYQSGAPYLLAETILVPSIWNEAYGRVAAEAQQYDCNILVSDRGGLKEALGDYPNGETCINIRDFSECLCLIENGLFKTS